jgi:hypothetical protein
VKIKFVEAVSELHDSVALPPAVLSTIDNALSNTTALVFNSRVPDASGNVIVRVTPAVIALESNRPILVGVTLSVISNAESENTAVAEEISDDTSIVVTPAEVEIGTFEVSEVVNVGRAST